MVKEVDLEPYHREFEKQVHFAKVCYADYLRSKYYRDPNEYVFMHIHHFLTHCANIERLLYPTPVPKDSVKVKEIKFVRRAIFQEIFGDKKKFKLGEFKNIRNDLEHFDERIDKWSVNSKRKNFFDMNISEGGQVSVSGTDKSDFFRNLEDNVLTFAGKRYDLDELYNIILKLEKAEKQLAKTINNIKIIRDKSGKMGMVMFDQI